MEGVWIISIEKKMKLIMRTEVTFFRMAFKDPAWHHGYNTQHSVLAPLMTPGLQHPKNIQHRVHIIKVYDDEVFTSKLIRP